MVGASRYIGRVGGLAGALGLGAAVFYLGCGIAGADSGTGVADDSRASASGESQSRAKDGATRGRTAPPAGNAAARTADSHPARSRAAAALAAPASDVDAAGAPESVAQAGAVAAPPPSPAAAVKPPLPPLPEIIPTVCSQSSEACAFVVGPSGVPIPDEKYEQVAMAWYVQPNSPDANFDSQVSAVFTPEGAYPITGVKNLPIAPSTQEGLIEVRETFRASLQVLQPGTPISFFGFSQSAIISSLLQIYQLDPNCAATGTCPPPAPPPPGWPIEGLDPEQVTFVTVGQEMNPNGGWFSRFTGFITPGPGLVFYGPTPEQTWARTINYTLGYDGFADYPRYPLNFLSSLNAAMGILLVHLNYTNRQYFQDVYGGPPGYEQPVDPVLANYGPAVACQDPTTTCKRLPTTPGTEATQEYYFIPTPNLPLLAPLRLIPMIGTPLADLIQPVVKVIVDLGYADWAHGFGSEADQPPANVLVEFGLLPQVNPLEVIGRLANGVVQGAGDFVAAFLPGGSISREIAAIGSAVTDTLSGVVSAVAQLASQPLRLPTLDDVFTTVQNVVAQVTGRIALAASALYATLLPLADFANAVVFSLPGYAVNLFIDGIEQVLSGDVIGGLLNAVGRPVAAAVGFAGIIAVFQSVVFALGALAAITGCGPAAPVSGFCIFPDQFGP